MTSRERALQFIKRGWKPVPVPPGEKGPRTPGWNRLRIAEKDVSAYFSVPALNVGILLGCDPEWVVDVDLDVAEAIELAPEFLPVTRSVFGRKSKQRSHWLYYSKGARTLKLEQERTTLVELRSSGLQTVFPGSTHPSGELVEWAEDGEPATVDADTLEHAVHALGEAARLIRSGFSKEAACRIAKEGRPERTQASQNRKQAEGTFQDAVDKYNAEHRKDYPRSNGDCPMCGHKDCFGQSGKDDSRWYCYSAGHLEPGLRGAYGYHGDALDIDAYAANLSRAALLRRDGYLTSQKQENASQVTPSSQKKHPRFMSASEYMDAWGNLPEVVTVPTGICALDEALGGGLPASQITQIVGGPGSRKSELVRQIRNHVLSQGHHVLHVDVELTVGLLGTRDIAQRADLPSAAVRDRAGWTDAQADGVATAQAHIRSLTNLWILCTPPLPVADLDLSIHETLEQIKSEKPKLIILDSLQQLSFGVEAKERRHEIERFIGWANGLAQTTGSAVLLTSERKRTSKDEGDPLHSAAESKSVEYQSAVMLVLEPEGKTSDEMAGKAQSDWEQRVRMVIAKNREGQKGKLPDVLVFTGPTWGFRVETAENELADAVLAALGAGPQTSTDIAKGMKRQRSTIDSVLRWLITRGDVERLVLKGRSHKVLYRLVSPVRLSGERSEFSPVQSTGQAWTSEID